MTPPNPRPTRPARRWASLTALLAVLLTWGLSACSGTASAQTGDCVERSGEDSYSVVDCSGAELRVLERQDLDADCATVPGVTEGYTDYGGDFQLCLGPRDVDPATAVNVADVGDCLAGVDASSGTDTSDVHRVDCADPSAGVQVLSRSEDVLPMGFECDDVPGTTATYSWTLKQTNDEGNPLADLNMTDILFCLGPAGVDPQSSPDVAQAGDCLRETGADPAYARVDCATPQAAYRVVERVDSGFLTPEMACSSAPEAVAAVQGGRNTLNGYVLCLARN